MNKEELIGKLQMVYVGDINALDELIGYYDGLKQVIEELKQEKEKIHHYKTLYQSLKKQKEELRSWLKEDKDKITVLDTKNNKAVKLGIVLGLGMCVEKIEELESVKDE